MIKPIIIIVVVLVILWIFWRYYYFFFDPKRIVPEGKNIVSPADGKVVYVKKISKNIIPISIKKKRSIRLSDITKTKLNKQDKYLIGVLMTPFSITHINRAPIKGKIEYMKHYYNKHLPMTKTWVNSILKRKPYYRGSPYLVENERQITLINGDFPLLLVQIADLYIKKIVSFVKEKDFLEKGQKIGLIRMSSQVDMIIPYKKSIKIKVKEGDKVRGGESIIAEY